MTHCTPLREILLAAPRCLTGQVVLLTLLSFLSAPLAAQSFRRGDANADDVVDVSDPVYMLLYLFAGESAPSCFDAGDANDDGSLDISDPTILLGFLFLGGPQPPAPHPDCGPDPTGDALDCLSFPGCEDGAAEIGVSGSVMFDTGGPVEGATVIASVVLEEAVARAAAARLDVLGHRKKTKKEGADPQEDPAGEKDGRVALGFVESAQTTTGADGSFELVLGPAELPARILIEVLHSPAGFPDVENARWDLAAEATLDVGAIAIPDPSVAEMPLVDGAGETTDGNVRIENLPATVDRFFACAYDPDATPETFPGEFAEMGSVPLNSSVFVWLEALDADGNPVDQLGQAATVRSRVPRSQWVDLEDIANGTDRIEIPIYVYNEDTDMWEQQELDGWLEDGVGTVLPEEVEELIVDGSFEGDIYATFLTDHLSWMNVDYAFIGPWTLSRMDSNRRNVDCFFRAIQLAKTIARSRAGIDGYKQFLKPGERTDANVVNILQDANGPEVKTESRGGRYGAFKGNEQGDRDDQFYMSEAVWNGCGDGATEEQKKNVILCMAVSILHETAHWTWDVHHEDGDWRTREPDGEAGERLERSLFGGVIKERADGTPLLNGRPVSAAQRDSWLDPANWPAPLSAGDGGGGGGDGVDLLPIALTISFPQQSIDLGEDLLVDVTFENTSGKPIDVMTLGALEGVPLSFEIVREGAVSRVPFVGERARRNIDYDADFSSLAAGESLTQTINLLRDPDSGERRYNLVQSGLHAATCFYSGNYAGEEVSSNAATFSLNAGGSVSGLVTDAEDGSPLADATVQAIQDGNILATATTGADGRYAIAELPGGVYDFEARARGFLRSPQSDVTVVAGQDNVVNFSLSPLLTAGEVRVVLTWGERPTDLDSHFWTPSEAPYHLYYARRGMIDVCPHAALDVDDTSSFGPETVTIAQRFGGSSLYAVHNFTGAPDFAVSEALVQVFDSSGLAAEFRPPDGGPAGIPDGGPGDWWTVFSIDGETGSVTEINTLGDDPAPYADTDMGCLEPIGDGDTCDDAVEIGDGSVLGATSGATSDGSASCASSATSPDAWYRYTAAATGTLSLDLCGSSYDTALSVHSDCPGDTGNELACNDDFCDFQSGLSVAVEEASSYLIRVSGFNGASGNFQLNVSLADVVEQLDGGDTCAEATPVVDGSYSGSSAGRGTDGAASCGNSAASPDAWYSFTPAQDCSAEVDLCGSSYDTVLSIHSACPGTAVNEIACNDDTCGLQSAVSFNALGGTTYYFRVSGFGGASGGYFLNLSSDCEPAVAPVPIPAGTHTGSTTDAASTGSSSCGNSTESPDAIYSITPDQDARLVSDTCGSSYDTVLSVHTSFPPTSENQIACNDDACGLQSAVVFDAFAGTTYYFRVSGSGGASGDFLLNVVSISVETPATPPAAPGNTSGGCGGGGAGGSIFPVPSMRSALDDRQTVSLHSGEFYWTRTDLELIGFPESSLRWTRRYRSRLGRSTAMGNNWEHSYNVFLTSDGDPIDPGFLLHAGDGYRHRMKSTPGLPGVFSSPGLAATLSFEANGRATVLFANGGLWSLFALDDSQVEGKLEVITDRNGNTIELQYDGTGRLVLVADTLGHELSVAYDPQDRVSSVSDSAGRQVTYAYYTAGDEKGSEGDLATVTSPAVTGTVNGNDFPQGKTTTYTYSTGHARQESNHNLLTVQNVEDELFLTNEYGTGPSPLEFDRLLRQTRGPSGSEEVTDYRYFDAGGAGALPGEETTAVVNDAVGNVTHHSFDSHNRLVRLQEFTGRADPMVATTLTVNRPGAKLRLTDPDSFVTRYEWNEDHRNTLVSLPDGSSLLQTYELDLDPDADPRTRGNLRERRRIAGVLGGDQAELVELFEYADGFSGCCGVNFVTRYTNPRLHVTEHEYDANGNRTRTVYPVVGLDETWTYDDRGRVTECEHALTTQGRRRDVFTYHSEASGHQVGRLDRVVHDAGGLGLVTRHTYDPFGNLTRIVDPRGADRRMTYNQLNQPVVSLTREATPGAEDRGETRYWYDSADRLVRRDQKWVGEDAGSKERWISTRLEYDSLARLSRKSVQEDGVELTAEEFLYDANGDLSLLRRPLAVSGSDPASIVRYERDERRLLLRETHAPDTPAETTVRQSYDTVGALAQRLVQSAAYDWEDLNLLHDGHGRVTRSTDALTGTETARQYDAGGNLVVAQVRGQSEVDGQFDDLVVLSHTTWVHDELNRQTQQSTAHFDLATAAAVGDGFSIKLSAWEGLGLLRSTTDDEGGVTTFEYDTANRRTARVDPASNRVELELDENSNPVQRRMISQSDLGQGVETRTYLYEYDGRNRRVSSLDPLMGETRWTFNSRGQLTSRVDARGNTELYFSDALGRGIRSEQVLTDTGDGKGSEQARIIFSRTYDAASRPISSTDANGNTTNFEYNSLDHLTRRILADSSVSEWSYDGPGLTETLDANGTRIAHSYAQGRLVARDVVQAGPGVAASNEQFSWDGLDRLVSGSDDDSLVVLGRDSLGNVVREALTIGTGKAAVTGVTTAVHDGHGALTSLTYPGGRVLDFELQHVSGGPLVKRITEVNEELASFSHVGRRVERREVSLGGAVEPLRSVFTFDSRGWLDSELHTRVAGEVTLTLAQFDHGFDEVGNSVQVDDLFLQRSHIMVHDSADRLVGAEHERAGDEDEIQAYVLDLQGNRLQVVGGPGAGDYTMVPANPPADFQVNQYTTTPFDVRSYDTNGNLVARTPPESEPLENVFDHANRAVQLDVDPAATEVCLYDALGRIIQEVTTSGKSTEVVRFFYCGTRLIEERRGEVEPQTTTWVWPSMTGPGAPTSLRSPTGQDFTLLESPEVGVVAVVDAVGAVVERYEYRDFGEVLDAGTGAALGASAVGNRFFFRGLRHDLATGQILSGGQRLDPIAGSAVSSDSSRPVGPRTSKEGDQVDFHAETVRTCDKNSQCRKGYKCEDGYCIRQERKSIDLPKPDEVNTARIGLQDSEEGDRVDFQAETVATCGKNSPCGKGYRCSFGYCVRDKSIGSPKPDGVNTALTGLQNSEGDDDSRLDPEP